MTCVILLISFAYLGINLFLLLKDIEFGNNLEKQPPFKSTIYNLLGFYLLLLSLYSIFGVY